MRRLAWDWFVDTLVAGAIIVLLAAATMGCQSTVTIDGKEFTPLPDPEMGRAMVAEQQCHPEQADACDLARKQRAVVLHPDHGWLLGPEVSLVGVLDAAAGVGFPDTQPIVPINNIADNRDWPWWGPTAGGVPSGSNAMFGYERGLSGSAIPSPTAVGGEPACSGTLIHGRSVWGSFATLGKVGVTAGHCLWRADRGDTRSLVFTMGWTLPFNRRGRFGDGNAFVCRPVMFMNAGWRYDLDHRYDVAVLDWRNAGCSVSDEERRIDSIYWQPVGSLPHTPLGGIGSQSHWQADAYHWGAPGTGLGHCGPRSDTKPSAETPPDPSMPYWPTACGNVGHRIFHQANTSMLSSGNFYSVGGHSGGPWATAETLWHNGAGRALVGVYTAWVTGGFFGNYHIAVARTPHIESWLQTSGVW